jgi:transcriptional regulator with XRE-family HTH domain
MGKKYPTDPQTIGKQLLKRRMDLRLLQKDVAKIMEITEESVMHWETERYPPQLQFYPGIIKFLGFNPFKVKGKTLAVRIKNYRFENGLSHKKMGALVGVDAATISTWETGKHSPQGDNLQQVETVLKVKITEPNTA